MLSNIIEQQKITLALKEKELPLNAILPSLTPSNTSFRKILQKRTPAFIFECKHRSPSEGELRNAYPVISLAQKYSQFCDAISVLTNKPFFGGCYSHLKKIREKINIPLLCKDIIINPYQVVLSRYYGADAVLLMLSVLDDKQYLACREQAIALNMDVLTEVSTENELKRAINLKANMIGVNHRDLNSMQLDMMRTIKLSPLFPQDALIIAASGLISHQQIHLLKPYVQGFLIGSHLSKSQDIDITMRELIFGHIKICGFTQKHDIQHAFMQGATFAGLIFAENSPRKVTLETAAMLVKAAPLRFIGIFVQQDIEFVSQSATRLNLYAVQLHGGENANYIAALRRKLPSLCQIWKAYASNAHLPLTLPDNVNKIVVDKTITTGGHGETFNWEKLKNSPIKQQIILAGGLNPENIHKAKQLELWGLDINSGVENTPGIKDKNKLNKLFSELRR